MVSAGTAGVVSLQYFFIIYIEFKSAIVCMKSNI